MFLLVVLELPCLHTRGGSVDQCGDKRRLAGPFTALPLPILPIEHSSSQVMHIQDVCKILPDSQVKKMF